MSETLLKIDNLRIGFQLGVGTGVAVRGISLAIRRGEAVGLVGESGSGKSVTALSVMGLLPRSARVLCGKIQFQGTDLLALSEQQLRRVRGKEISMIFQDPLVSLNPVFTIGQQLVDIIRTHQDVDGTAARARAIEALSMVGISSPAARLTAYPHEFSGGMRQRALIAMAIACRPQLLIADEPTTALDVTVQAQVVSLLSRLRSELGLAILFITHNLDLMAELCDRVAVMYAGTIVEEASVEDLFTTPLHPYTNALMRCIPRLSEETVELESIEGNPPAIESTLAGCPFQPRCPRALDICSRQSPSEQALGGHRVSCWAAGPMCETIAL
jgi:oligopeptide/dipeptide ABC transporter ATP-binding protein